MSDTNFSRLSTITLARNEENYTFQGYHVGYVGHQKNKIHYIFLRDILLLVLSEYVKSIPMKIFNIHRKHQITRCIIRVFEQQTCLRLFGRLPAFYGIRRLITVFREAHPCLEADESSLCPLAPAYFFEIHSNIICISAQSSKNPV